MAATTSPLSARGVAGFKLSPPRRVLRPYASKPVTIDPTRLPLTPLRFVVVAWGSSPSYAAIARRRADEFAYDNYLHVVDHVVSHGPRVREAALYDTASSSAVYRWSSYDVAWWLLDASPSPVYAPRMTGELRTPPTGPDTPKNPGHPPGPVTPGKNPPGPGRQPPPPGAVVA